MIVTATPEPANIPPRVRIDLTANAGESISDVVLTRDGSSVREQPYPGSQDSVTFDYEAPFGLPVIYTADGNVLPPTAADWTETWASLAAWSGDTGSFSVSGGKARSSVAGAQIHRAATGTIQRVAVADPSYVRVEVLDASDGVVASVQVDTKVTVTGTTTQAVSGGGSFAMSLSDDALSVTADDASWSVSKAYTGVPVTVRVVGLGISYPAGLSFSTAATPSSVAVDSDGNIYVLANKLVHKYDSSGVEVTTGGFPFSTTGSSCGVAVDSAGKIYVVDYSGNKVRKFSAAGVEVTTGGFPISLGHVPTGLALDASGNIYVSDYVVHQIRKFNTSGVEVTTGGFPISTTGSPQSVTVDSAGNIYAGVEPLVRKFNTSGVQTLSFSSIGSTDGLAVDAGGNIYVADWSSNLVRKFNTSGVQTLSLSGTNHPIGVALDSGGSVYVASEFNKLVRKYVATTPSVGTVVETPVASPQAFSATDTATLDVDEAWLIHPTFPSLSCSIDPGQHKFRDDGINVDVASKTTLTRAAKSSRHDPVGRRRSVVFTSGARAAGEWELQLRTRRLQDRNTVDAICDDQSSLLVRSPQTWPWDLPDGWYSVGDYTEERPRPRLDTADRLITLPLTPVAEPAVRLAAVWTYAAGLLRNATYANSKAEFPTYLERLVGP